ncbi:hypothetical protein GF336_03195 [Candidatus Woesearchaeota archaeon]|nr:hypothetical protein [Candidatus Woesearchaeota archaeon]
MDDNIYRGHEKLFRNKNQVNYDNTDLKMLSENPHTINEIVWKQLSKDQRNELCILLDRTKIDKFIHKNEAGEFNEHQGKCIAYNCSREIYAAGNNAKEALETFNLKYPSIEVDVLMTPEEANNHAEDSELNESDKKLLQMIETEKILDEAYHN